MPTLLTGDGYYIITDEEKAIVQSIKKILPATDFYRCWNHVKEDIKRHIPATEKGTKLQTKKDYQNDVCDLLEMASKDDYNARLLELEDEWDPVRHYYTVEY